MTVRINSPDKSTVFHQGADINSAHGICVLDSKALISYGDDVFWLIDALSADESARGPAHSQTLPRSSDAPEGAKRPGVLQSSGAYVRLLTSAFTDNDHNVCINSLRSARQLWQQKNRKAPRSHRVCRKE